MVNKLGRHIFQFKKFKLPAYDQHRRWFDLYKRMVEGQNPLWHSRLERFLLNRPSRRTVWWRGLRNS